MKKTNTKLSNYTNVTLEETCPISRTEILVRLLKSSSLEARFEIMELDCELLSYNTLQ